MNITGLEFGLKMENLCVCKMYLLLANHRFLLFDLFYRGPFFFFKESTFKHLFKKPSWTLDNYEITQILMIEV